MGPPSRTSGDNNQQARPHPSLQVSELAGDEPLSQVEVSGYNPTTQSEYLGDFGTGDDGSAENEAPPAYSESHGTLDMGTEGFNSRADVLDDGRINIDINEKSRRLSYLIPPALYDRLEAQLADDSSAPPQYIPPSIGGADDGPPPPRMNVVIQVVGSRGDVQPFIALGLVLKEKFNHRIRVATHAIFRDFVLENGLEFFNIGGDPTELMAFMVKNQGLIPSRAALMGGEIEKRRRGMYEIMRGCWRSCFEAGEGANPVASNDQPFENIESTESSTSFVADAIIANPPSFAHIHCAERLGIPLHLMFTMPWSPTGSFPHPLANVQSSSVNKRMTNYISYVLVEMMTWQGLGTLINRFREKTLGLDPLSQIWGPGIAARMKVPYTYCWSPALIPKPADWGPHIHISGFYFLSLANNYQPHRDLVEFLGAGPPPIYIGFGSIVVDDPDALTDIIYQAVQRTGQRCLLSKGWGAIGASTEDVPNSIFMLDNVPHDWLFHRVSAVVHHGGAGTTAAGLSAGKPSIIVPFFGDQPFWGAMIAKAGAGPTPIPHKALTADNLTDAINFALQPTTVEKAEEIGAKVRAEDGNQSGAKSFHDTLDPDSLRCSVAPNHVAAWRVRKSGARLSALAASVLCYQGVLKYGDLSLFRPKEYEVDRGPLEPFTGGAAAFINAFSGIAVGVIAEAPAGAYRAGKTLYKYSNQKRIAKVTLKAQSRIETVPDNSLENASAGGRPPYIKTASNESSTKAKVRCPPRQSSTSSSQILPPSTKETVKLPSMTLGSALGAGTGKGIARMVDAALKAPVDLPLSVARGLHNAPRLWGDQTVRQPDRITDIQSGLVAAGKEFGLGIYDGVSGLVTQPVRGAMKEGVTGAIKGVGFGIGGFFMKPGAALMGLPAYALQGVYKEVQKALGSSVQAYIVAARISQGYREWNDTSPEEREEILSLWEAAEKARLANQRRWYGLRSSKGKEKAEIAGMSKSSLSESKTSIDSAPGSGFSTGEDRVSIPSTTSDLEAPVYVEIPANENISPPYPGNPYPTPLRFFNGAGGDLDTDSVISTSPPSELEDTVLSRNELHTSDRPSPPRSQALAIRRRPVPQSTASNSRSLLSAGQNEGENYPLNSTGDGRNENEEDEDLRKAIKASMAESQARSSGPSGVHEDAELEAAIMASMTSIGRPIPQAEGSSSGSHAPDEDAELEAAIKLSLAGGQLSPSKDSVRAMDYF